MDDVDWVGATEAIHLAPDDPVLGLVLDGRSWALPWSQVSAPHIANLTLGAEPVLVTLCPACSHAAAFRPVVDGQRLRFRVAGIHNGAMIMADRSQGSLWLPGTGTAVTGPFEGRELEHLPLYQCRWREWHTLCPDTRVLSPTAAPVRVEQTRPVAGEHRRYPRVSRTLLRADARLASETLTLGVTAGASHLAIPLSLIHRHGGMLHLDVDGTTLVAFSPPGTWLAVAYDTAVDGRSLRFDPDSFRMVDRQTGSHWDFTGRAVSGSLTGTQLRLLASRLEEWQTLAARHPGIVLASEASATENAGQHGEGAHAGGR
ncbi:hypothetical protein THITH_04255 [Thioalkalivibrio paradoxus ARh 1]|uniref:DUF3179 domain-containing protein n=1 Tax=Thioalkalivibrio paradoxus ARh 1 TaxID=713585 RepID=W0DL30_9GAMM|nr:hypothetical protein THITH_04255 [Thioalkalivibrio paradoxus ARh 1]